MSIPSRVLVGGGLAAALLVASACNPPGSRTAASSDTSVAAKSFVPPGEKDEYYLFYSGGDYANDDYAVGYATCKGPLGPCTDAPENPILKTSCRAHGPGHNSLIEVGDQTWIVYHAWLPNHRGDKRVLWIDKLDWQDGKPVVHGPTCTAQAAP